MTTPLFALFVRSLRQDAQLKLIYAARAGLVAVVAVFMVLSVLASGWRGAPGLNFFTAIVHIQAVFITLAGLSYFASAITEEKEEQMLGLLRMTELNPLSILLGKSTSRLCTALLLLAAQFPFTLLAITLGGVTTRQIVASYLALGAYTFLLCNLALLASVTQPSTGRAALRVGLLLLVLWSPQVLFLPIKLGATPVTSPVAALFTPGRLNEILSTGFDGALFGPQFYYHVGLGLFAFALAWLVFDRCATGEAEGSANNGRWSWRRRFPPGRAWPRAIVWKDAQFIHGGRGVVLLKFIVYGLALTGFMTARFGDDLLGMFTSANASPTQGMSTSDIAAACLLAAWFGCLALVAELGFAASRLFSVEVREQTISSLILLPITLRELHRAKVQSCYQAVLPLVCYLALCLTGALIAGIMDNRGPVPIVLITGFGGVGLIFACAQVLLLFHLIAWLSLKVPRGALPLGIAILMIGNLAGFFLGMITFGIAMIVLPFVAVILSGVFQTKLLQRLETITSEE